MEGEAFAHARIPVQSLIEIQRYGEAVLEAACFAWLRDHPGSDLPSDFRDGFQLVMADVEEGSATPVLERDATSTYDDYYSLGRDDLDRTAAELETWLETDEESRPDIDLASLELLGVPAFVNLGSSLPEGARLEVISASATHPQAFSADLRTSALIPLAAARIGLLAPTDPPKVKLQSTPGEVAGQLFSLDADKRSFDMMSVKHGKLHGRYTDDKLTSDLRAVLANRDRAPLVRFTALLRFEGDKLVRLLRVTQVQLLETDGKPWSRRFKELATLDRGWDGTEESEAVVFAALDAARELLNECVTAHKAVPGLFPMPDGGVQLEWSEPSFVTSIEISPDIEFTLFDLDVATSAVRESMSTDLGDAKKFVREVVR